MVMFGLEFRMQCYQSIFDPHGHTRDVFSEAELRPLGGGAGLIKKLNNANLKVIGTPQKVAAHFSGQNVVVVEHQFGKTEELHMAFEKLGLQKESMLILD